MGSAAESPRSNRLWLAASSRPTTHTPAFRSRSTAVARPETTAIGMCSMAPAAALAAVGVMWTARWRGSTTPVAPAPSADRRIAPRLPGSVTPSTSDEERAAASRPGGRRSSRSASWRGAALASTPCGASLRASASSRLRLTSLDRNPQVGGEGRGCRPMPPRSSIARWPPTARAPCVGRPAGARAPPGGLRPARRRGPSRRPVAAAVARAVRSRAVGGGSGRAIAGARRAWPRPGR